MGLPAKLHGSHKGNLIDGSVDVSSVQDATDYVNYDEAGRPRDMCMSQGTDLWRRQGYYGLTSSNTSFRGNGNRRLYYIHVGPSQGSLNLAYYYDSFGDVKMHYDNAGYNTFSYDGQNRLTSAYGKSYNYDPAGRAQGAPAHYEGTNYTSYDDHAIRKSGYSYDANGNLTSRNGRTLSGTMRTAPASQVWQHRARELSLR